MKYINRPEYLYRIELMKKRSKVLKQIVLLEKIYLPLAWLTDCLSLPMVLSTMKIKKKKSLKEKVLQALLMRAIKSILSIVE